MEQIYHSKLPDAPVPEGLSVHQFLTRYNPDMVAADKPILEDLGFPHKKLTYGGLRTQAAMGAAALAKQYGLQPGDTVLIYSGNSVDYSVFAHSVMWLGGVVGGVNTAWSGAELAHAIATIEPKIIACEVEFTERVKEALQIKPIPQPIPLIVELGEHKGSFTSSYIDRPSGFTPLPPFDLTGRDNRKHPCLILFSSGTTGNPKAALLSHYNVIAHLQANRTTDAWLNNCDAREVFFAPFPHMIGALGAVLYPAYMGSYVAAMKKFTLPDYMKACAKVQATTLKVVPSVAIAFAQHPLVKQLDLSSVKYILSAGATLQPEVIRKMQDLLKGVSFVQTYGMSETLICTLPYNKSIDKMGSVGRLLSGVRIRIVNEKLQDVELGTPGEVLVKAPTVFMGYKNNIKATNESFHNEWLRTGDILSIDADGFLWFHERQKELIKVKGNQVAPSELEGILNAHPKVLAAAVCGYFDEDRQTDWPVGYVVLDASLPVNDRSAVLEEIRAWFDGQVATYKKLRGGLHYIDELPKNPTGKLMRGQLPIKLAAKRKNRI